jgi:hypothetical protein
MGSWICIANADPDRERENKPLKRRKIKSEDQKKIIKINVFYAIIF